MNKKGDMVQVDIWIKDYFAINLKEKAEEYVNELQNNCIYSI